MVGRGKLRRSIEVLCLLQEEAKGVGFSALSGVEKMSAARVGRVFLKEFLFRSLYGCIGFLIACYWLDLFHEKLLAFIEDNDVATNHLLGGPHGQQGDFYSVTLDFCWLKSIVQAIILVDHKIVSDDVISRLIAPLVRSDGPEMATWPLSHALIPWIRTRVLPLFGLDTWQPSDRPFIKRLIRRPDGPSDVVKWRAPARHVERCH
ncbi:hypothetical protein MA16_Dca024811 [Dendrobium catenatum]|uniref:Uncharacterized protein n=1 Tax=Dendrobium catenatum TaxID=906689 RepID=A0A2I0XCU7_9ASPA|nr:hypothetical protein MA16_Dca024811 [Dendrobium catenatum]